MQNYDYNHISSIKKENKDPYLPFEKGMILNLLKLESPLPRDALYQIRLEIDRVVLNRIFKSCQSIFTISLVSPLGKGMAFYLKKRESPSPRLLHAKFG